MAKKILKEPSEMVELKKVVDTINALKQSTDIILGDNKEIDIKALSSVQKNIYPTSLENEYLLNFMKENSIKSYFDVDVIKLMQFFHKKTDRKFVVK
ncbi:hypothetical protein H0A43_03350 [Arcobacter lanthieri]|uniref:hypothetical protein n=1 Tax=Aliarcobacter lanthieri TaxID=1355374 RepID=UPI0019217BE0|nr:hypothetical protein [Aliarcobacter lanthieri]MBL3519493.1 hypothetical protein [Aliarcobacter lanthieri]